mgnify:CR=1 FL=1
MFQCVSRLVGRSRRCQGPGHTVLSVRRLCLLQYSRLGGVSSPPVRAPDVTRQLQGEGHYVRPRSARILFLPLSSLFSSPPEGAIAVTTAPGHSPSTLQVSSPHSRSFLSGVGGPLHL